MIRNIIYDLDGTLINSSKDIINSFNYAFKINNLKTKPSIYSSILTPQGRFISDFFLSNYKNSFLLEINKNDETDILQKLSIYKLRSKINISVVKNAEIFVISNDSEKSFREYKKESLCFNDPRFGNIFKRL